MRPFDPFHRPLRASAVLLALFGAAALYAIGVQQHFSIDGSHNFVELMRRETFTFGDQFPRHHAHYVMQGFMVALMNVGVRDPGVLSWAFGVGLYFPLIAGPALSAVIARRADPRFVLFPLLGLFGIGANHTFMIISESHVTAALFWPLFFLVLLKERFDGRNAALAVVLALLFVRTYESVAVLGAILVAALLLRAREGWPRAASLTRAVWVLLSLILLSGVAIAAYYALNPLSPGNRADFFGSFGRIVGHWPALLSLGFLTAVASFVLVPGFSSSAAASVVTAVLAVLALVVATSPIAVPGALRPGLHYATRANMLVTVPALAVLTVVVVRGWVRVDAVTWRRIGMLVAILALCQTTWLFLAARQWDGFRTVFRQELASHRGLVPFEQTRLSVERIDGQVLSPMTWAWTQPTLSILWAPDRQVRSLILNPVAWKGWTPFDPTDPRAFPRLEEFGYSTAPLRDALQR